MAKVIITGVDGSETADRAAAKAAELAVALEAPLQVVTVYRKFETETFSSGHETFEYTTSAAAERTAVDVASDLGRKFPGLDVTGVAAQGKPAEALVELAEQVDAQLIVVGNKRVQGLARILGSIARDVAQTAHCDVYIAHTVS